MDNHPSVDESGVHRTSKLEDEMDLSGNRSIHRIAGAINNQSQGVFPHLSLVRQRPRSLRGHCGGIDDPHPHKVLDVPPR